MIELDYIKAHLRITGTDEDALLTSYGEAAEEVVQKYINQQWDEVIDEYGAIPHALKNAVCMVVGSMYRDREATSNQSIAGNPIFTALVKPYKKIIPSLREG